MLDNYNEQDKGEEGYYGSQKLRHTSFWQRHRGLVIAIGVLVILLVIFATSTFLLLSSRTQPTTTSSSVQSAPTQTASVNTPGQSTPVSVVSATPTVLATVAAGTYTPNLKLHTNADDPITVTITSMTYNPSENKMVWDLILMNVSSSDQPVSAGTFTLKSDAEGENYTHEATLTGLNPAITIATGAQIKETITFTFVPYQKASGVSYTLTSSIVNAQYDFYSYDHTITFDPITMTF